jgi:RNA recognition motif-containing protein
MIFVREDRETSSHAGPGGSSRGTAVGGQTSVYVWNLAYDTSWQDLKDHCRAAGNVDQATILSGPDGRSNGCGIVVYQHPKEAARAIRELQNTELNGRPIYLREDRSQSGRGGGAGRGGGRAPGRGRGGRGSRGGNAHPSGKTITPGCQVFVSNLSFETSWQDLKDHFRQIGEIAHADVKESADGQSKGFGTVRFNDPADALKAIAELNGVELKGRALEVRLDQRAG